MVQTTEEFFTPVLSRRDLFAGLLLAGVFANPGCHEPADHIRYIVKSADKPIAELDKTEEE